VYSAQLTVKARDTGSTVIKQRTQRVTRFWYCLTTGQNKKHTYT